MGGRVVEDRNWIDRANCRGSDPDRFFVRGATQARAAQRLCERCPVQEACLEYALANDIDFGVWGGLTERQRRSLQRRRYAAVG
jgi:WhiB family redox-sensing transcriptional regulator